MISPSPRLRILLGALIAAGLAWPAAGDEVAPSARYRGSLSCSAAACHGGLPSSGTREGTGLDTAGVHRGGEYHIWAQQDPHARAFQSLFNDQSDRIIEHLARTAASAAEPFGAGRPASGNYELVWQRCLTCHTASRDAPPPSVLLTADGSIRIEVVSPFQEGVGCEACHGAASEPWFREHSRAGWRARDARERERMGFVDTAHLLTRARLCADCHVGSVGRDVNHDLIAAGHPAMRFELAGYSDLLPKHWNDARERRVVPWFEWRLWAAGQVATSTAALELLRERARPLERRAAPPVWPEFAEYSCEACHHDLRQAWRRRRGFMTSSASGWSRDLSSAARVVPPWGLWPMAVLPELAGAPYAKDDARGSAVGEAMGDVRSLMQAGLFPDRAEVVVPADTALARIERWRSAPEVDAWLNVTTRGARPGPRSPADITRKAAGSIAQALLTERSGLTDSWERSTQVYLMIAPWERAWRDESAPRVPAANIGRPPGSEESALRHDLRRLRDLLATSPGAADPAESAARADAGDRTIREEIQQLLVRSLEAMRDGSVGVPR